MHESLRELYAELAKAIGLTALPADEMGATQLTIGDDISVVLLYQDSLIRTDASSHGTDAIRVVEAP